MQSLQKQDPAIMDEPVYSGRKRIHSLVEGSVPSEESQKRPRLHSDNSPGGLAFGSGMGQAGLEMLN